MTYRYCLALLALLMPLSASAQTTCPEAEATAVLEGGDVRAALYNNGNLFHQRSDLYEIPAGSGNRPVFAANLWIGGMVDGELRMTRATYDTSFRPGPLDADASPSGTCEANDRLWYVSHSDLEYDLRVGTDVAGRSDWPAELGAPYLDRDGVPGYDAARGDLPEILGTAMGWWVMNDVAAPRDLEATVFPQTPPIGLEARVSAWAHDEPGWPSRTTFYRYALTYRGDAPLDSALFGVYVDAPLGAGGTHVGSDSTLNLAYTYHGDGDDATYGDRPPALGLVVLEAPDAPAGNGVDDDRDGTIDEVGEDLGLGAFVTYEKTDRVQGNPQSPEEHYGYLDARWRDGKPITFGGTGRYFSETPTRYMYSGEPGAFWSEGDIDGEGTALRPSFRRMLLSIGPFRMEPGATDTVTFAIVWEQELGASENPHFASVAKLKQSVAELLADRERYLQPRLDLYARYPVPEPEAEHARIAPPAPNPTLALATLSVKLPSLVPSHVDVYDLLGRRVHRAAVPARPNAEQEVRLDLTALPAGVYVWRVVVPGAGVVGTGTVVKL